VDTATPPPGEQPPPPPPATLGGLKLDGTGASLKLGFLFQPSYELASGSLTSTQTLSHFFIRRIRLMAGLTVGSQLEFFFDTDSPNIARNANVAPTAGMAVQDAFMTWKPMDEFKLDGGMMLIPFTHNSDQGATTLYGLDYFAGSFTQNTGFGNFVGRDVGVQARGLVIGHLEYRLGVFTGARGAPMSPMSTNSRAQLRLAARVQYNLFDPETAFFYAGTYGGTKKILSIGGGVDWQDDYKAFAGDVFLDWPLGTDVLTAQFNVAFYNGGGDNGGAGADAWIALPKQTDFMGEIGYRIGSLKINPIFTFAMQSFDNDAMFANVRRIGGGLVYWYMGHNANVKVFYTNIHQERAANSSWHQIQVQTQFFVF